MDSSGIDADKEPVEPCPLDCPLRSYALEPNRKLPADIRLRQLPLPPQAALAARIYTPIRDWQTRLLCLQPGRFGDPIIADLSVVDLIYFEGVVARETEEVLAYEALSYCWGEPQYEYPIRLNGHLYSVTRNLYAALQHLRFEDRRRWLWIDACCINQYDNAEKSSQILNMLAIFEKAETVIVWLGEPAEGSCLAFGYIPHYALGRATEHARWHCNKGGVRLYRGLRYVYSRPWLRRVWIRQEIFAARVVTVRCGDQAIDWEQFESGDKWLSSWIAWPDTVQDLQPLGDEHRRALSGLRDVRFGARIVSPVNMSDNSNYSFTYDRAHDIVRVLRDAADCEASNPLDRVYGLLGMTSIGYPSRRRNKGSLPKLVVDYKKSPSRVFQDVANTPDSYTYIGAAIPCFDLTVPVDAEDPKYDYDDGMHEVRSEKEEAKTSRELTTELSSSLSSCMHDVLRQEKESLDVFRVV
ncbi:hypothetical protein H2203_009044 [Taxawa tesnikishii (nom. ined.)]|nr:hypothetical protein H2203_009044 [Dothideales sp. JES 119]